MESDHPTAGTAHSVTLSDDANGSVVADAVKLVRDNSGESDTEAKDFAYAYDPYGRLRTIQGGGKTQEKYTYDGFDHVVKHEKLGGDGVTSAVTSYTYDPLDRTTTKTEKEGTANAKTTTYSYLGLSAEVLDEEVAGRLTRSFQYSPWGERLSQVKFTPDNREESSYYGYNPHTDVEQITSETGDTRATYGYTAYGSNDDTLFTGVDKPEPVDPTAKEEYNPYRFNSKRWDNSTGMYDMGFRDYNPGLNRFLLRDTYNGALDDLSLGTDPWTSNRYAFTGGNPISGIEHDGHEPRPWHDPKFGKKSKAAQTAAIRENRRAHDSMLQRFVERGRVASRDAVINDKKSTEMPCGGEPCSDGRAVPAGLIGEGEGEIAEEILDRAGGRGASKGIKKVLKDLIEDLFDEDSEITLYRSPQKGNKASEANGLNSANHPDTYDPKAGPRKGTASLGESEDVVEKYAGYGTYEDGWWEYKMKPGFLKAFPLHRYRFSHDGKSGEYQWEIPRDKISLFNSFIDGKPRWMNYMQEYKWYD